MIEAQPNEQHLHRGHWHAGDAHVKPFKPGAKKIAGAPVTRLLPAACLLSAGFAAGLAAGAVQPAAGPRLGPLTDAPLAVIRPADFLDPGGTGVIVSAKGTVFEEQAVPLRVPVRAVFQIRRSGDYTLWIRSHQPPGGAEGTLQAELARQGGVLAQGTFNDGAGSPERGGAEAWAEYRRLAVKNTSPRKAMTDMQASLAGGIDPADALFAEPLDAQTGTLADEMFEDLRKKSATRWATLDRLEQPGETPFYWWRPCRVRLEPGEYELRLRPLRETDGGGDPALVDAAILTDCPEMSYPYAGDIGHDRATYIRFRLDALPPEGVGITTWLRIHWYAYPKQRTDQYWLNPGGLVKPNEGAVVPPRQENHTRTGHTRWYRLQDIELCPPFNYRRYDINLHLILNRTEGVAGATDFAPYPFQDSIVRTISWNEPAGLTVSMQMDLERRPDRLRTFRDHAREHYDMAIRAAGGRVHPLTRGKLLLRMSGDPTADTEDYLFKTLRLLGANRLNSGSEPLATAGRYGWEAAAGGAARMAWHLPFDEEESRRKYEEIYSHYTNPAQRALYGQVSALCMADEPGEGSRAQMSSPLWLYVEEDGKPPKWTDPPGSSALHTRATNLTDCVLEGMFRRIGSGIELRVATDRSDPAHFAFWLLQPSVTGEQQPENVGAGLDAVYRGSRNRRQFTRAFTHKAADTGDKPTRFKIVYERGRAALFLNETLIHQHENLPAAGGFGFAGDAKEIWDLRLRPVSDQERLSITGVAAAGEGTLTLAEDGEDDAAGAPEWARPRPLKEWIEQEWVVGGGMPQAHAGFRRWIAAQGVGPEFFGASDWNGVRMLTIADLVRTPADARRYYWSRRYSGWLTPRMWSLAMDGIRANFPNKDVMSYVALSGGGPNAFNYFPVDMFQTASHANGLMPGISDWHTGNTESPQVNAFSVAMFNAGARRPGLPPASVSMMHCVSTTELRSYVTFANNVKYISFFNFGPAYTGAACWSDSYASYTGTACLNNRLARVDDLAAPGLMRPSRVALLYPMSSDYWGHVNISDRRATFLALSHEYYQPEIVTEEQVADGVLANYDALYVLDPHVLSGAQEQIAAWVRAGGLLWACSEAASRNAFNEPEDLLGRLAGLKRTLPPSTGWPPSTGIEDAGDLVVAPVAGEAQFRPHRVVAGNRPQAVEWAGARVRARYADGQPAWLEGTAGKGRVVYVAHRAGQSYSSKVVRHGEKLWADTGRGLLTTPLHEAGIARELTLSVPCFVATPLESERGTLVVLASMRPGPREGVEMRLREAAPPHSVQIFDGDRLVDLPFSHEDGVIKAVLPPFEGGQMVAVRRTAPPADNRPEQMRVRAERLLASDLPASLSSGAFYAGHFPEWRLGDRLVPLLEHADWRVRRQAAEALGTAGHTAAGDALLARFAAESDSHVRGDLLVALARLGRAETRDHCLAALDGADVFVRRQAQIAARLLLFGDDDASTPASAPGIGTAAEAFGLAMARRGAGDYDLRVRREGIRLLGILDAGQTLAGARAAFGLERPDEFGRPHWADAVAGSDAAFAAFIEQQGGAAAGTPPPPDGGLALALAARRAAPELVPTVAAVLEAMQADDFADCHAALIRQRDRGLLRRAVNLREALPKPFLPRLADALERVFEAGIGGDLDAWDEWLKADAER